MHSLGYCIDGIVCKGYFFNFRRLIICGKSTDDASHQPTPENENNDGYPSYHNIHQTQMNSGESCRLKIRLENLHEDMVINHANALGKGIQNIGIFPPCIVQNIHVFFRNGFRGVHRF